MKTYIKPLTQDFVFQLESSILTPSVGGGVNNESLENGSGDLTRGKQGGGFGKGLWEE